MSDMNESLDNLRRLRDKANMLRKFVERNFYKWRPYANLLAWKYCRDRQPYHIRRYYDRFYRDRYPWLRQGKRPKNDGRAIARLIRRKPRQKARFGYY